ncbi:MAG: type II secretion system F family protein [Actinobacteria bacterium]|nr:type II secretion system F family protein [Actinomycetota bacterium]
MAARSGGERRRPDDTSDVERASSGAPSLPSTGSSPDSGPAPLASLASPLTSLDDLPGHPEQTVPERRWFTRRREQAPVAKDNRTASRRREDTAAAARAAAADAPDPKDAPWWRRQYGKTVAPDVVMAFSRQMASFVEAGISVLEALEIVGEESGDAEMKKVVQQMHATLQRGGSFSEAVAKHPSVFPPYYRAMVRSAEFTGKLDEVLEQLAVYLDRDLTAKRQVRSALTYPTVVLVVTSIAMVVMSVFVLPKFAGMYRSLGADLPLPTRMLLSSTDFFTGNLPFLAAGAIASFLVAYAVIGGGHGKARRDRLMMRLPVVGHLFHIISLERFCRVLSALAKAGVPLPEAIEMSAASTNNTVFVERMTTVRETLIRGGGLSAPVADTELFPTAARQMIRVGEKTGTLSVQLGKAAGYYEREVAFHMKKATELFQPAVIMFVGGLVGFVAVAQVSAMYSIFGQVQTP